MSRASLEVVERNELVKEMIDLEPVVYLALRTAAAQDRLYNRWELYSRLKCRCLDYVGFGAQKPLLATTHHYQALCWALDALLPDEGEAVEIEEEELQEVKI